MKLNQTKLSFEVNPKGRKEIERKPVLENGGLSYLVLRVPEIESSWSLVFFRHRELEARA